MAECSEIEAGGEVRTIKDATARQGVAANTQAIAAINEKIPASASSSNKLATDNDIPNVTPFLRAGGSLTTIVSQPQWLRTEPNALRYVNNTGRPILVTGLFRQAAQYYSTTIKDDATIVAGFSNLSGQTDFEFTLVAVIKAGGTMTVYNDNPEEVAVMLHTLMFQTL